jgi:hypothetical protein
MTDNAGYQPQKFPKLNTIPSGWDCSDLDGPSNNGHYHPNSQKPAALDCDAAPKMETFPKTNTFPGQWDMSNLND